MLRRTYRNEDHCEIDDETNELTQHEERAPTDGRFAPASSRACNEETGSRSVVHELGELQKRILSGNKYENVSKHNTL